MSHPEPTLALPPSPASIDASKQTQTPTPPLSPESSSRIKLPRDLPSDVVDLILHLALSEPRAPHEPNPLLSASHVSRAWRELVQRLLWLNVRLRSLAKARKFVDSPAAGRYPTRTLNLDFDELTPGTELREVISVCVGLKGVRLQNVQRMKVATLFQEAMAGVTELCLGPVCQITMSNVEPLTLRSHAQRVLLQGALSLVPADASPSIAALATAAQAADRALDTEIPFPFHLEHLTLSRYNDASLFNLPAPSLFALPAILSSLFLQPSLTSLSLHPLPSVAPPPSFLALLSLIAAQLTYFRLPQLPYAPAFSTVLARCTSLRHLHTSSPDVLHLHTSSPDVLHLLMVIPVPIDEWTLDTYADSLADVLEADTHAFSSLLRLTIGGTAPVVSYASSVRTNSPLGSPAPFSPISPGGSIRRPSIVPTEEEEEALREFAKTLRRGAGDRAYVAFAARHPEVVGVCEKRGVKLFLVNEVEEAGEGEIWRRAVGRAEDGEGWGVGAAETMTGGKEVADDWDLLDETMGF